MRPLPVPAPMSALPLKSGTLNVVDPSPTPYVVLIAVNRSAYVVRETAVPSHSNSSVSGVDRADTTKSPARHPAPAASLALVTEAFMYFAVVIEASAIFAVVTLASRIFAVVTLASRIFAAVTLALASAAVSTTPAANKFDGVIAPTSILAAVIAAVPIFAAVTAPAAIRVVVTQSTASITSKRTKSAAVTTAIHDVLIRCARAVVDAWARNTVAVGADTEWAMTWITSGAPAIPAGSNTTYAISGDETATKEASPAEE